MPTTDQLVAAILTPAQHEAVDFYRALNVPASWFIGQPDSRDGSVEVLALGRSGPWNESTNWEANGDGDQEGSFVWSIIIDNDGQTTTSEARVTSFSTGIDV